MKTSTRKSVGAVMLAISVLAIPALYVSRTPLLSLETSQTGSLPGGGSFTVASYKIHWPLLVVCIVALLGLIALVWPPRTPPRLKS